LYFALNLPASGPFLTKVKGLYHSNLPSTLEFVCDVPSLLHAHTNKNQKMQILTNTYRRRAHARAHPHTRKHQHRNTCTRHLQSLDDDVLRHSFQHHIWVCLIISDSIERSHLICFTCSTLFLRLYWNRICSTSSFSCNDGPLEHIIIKHASKESPIEWLCAVRI